MAAFLGVAPDKLAADFLTRRREAMSRPERFEIPTGLGGYCLFYRGGCLIQPVKPAVCRLWPYFPLPLSGEGALLEAASHCPGLAGLAYGDFLASYEAWLIAGGLSKAPDGR